MVRYTLYPGVTVGGGVGGDDRVCARTFLPGLHAQLSSQHVCSDWPRTFGTAYNFEDGEALRMRYALWHAVTFASSIVRVTRNSPCSSACTPLRGRNSEELGHPRMPSTVRTLSDGTSTQVFRDHPAPISRREGIGYRGHCAELGSPGIVYRADYL